MQNNEIKRFTLRLPAELYRQIVKLAREGERSLNGQIVHLLRRAVEMEGDERGK